MNLENILEVNSIYASIHGWDGNPDTAILPFQFGNDWVFSFTQFPLTLGVMVLYTEDARLLAEYAYKFTTDNSEREWSYTLYNQTEPFQTHTGTFKFEL